MYSDCVQLALKIICLPRHATARLIQAEAERILADELTHSKDLLERQDLAMQIAEVCGNDRQHNGDDNVALNKAWAVLGRDLESLRKRVPASPIRGRRDEDAQA